MHLSIECVFLVKIHVNVRKIIVHFVFELKKIIQTIAFVRNTCYIKKNLALIQLNQINVFFLWDNDEYSTIINNFYLLDVTSPHKYAIEKKRWW